MAAVLSGFPKATRTSLALVLVACLWACTGGPRAGGGFSPSAGTRGTLVIHGTGDVSLDPSQIPLFRTRGYGWAWSGLGDAFSTDDLTIVNLECAATDVVDPVPKAYTIRCDPSALPAMRAAGVDVASQANNHAYDEGSAGLLDSLSEIRAAGLVPVGAGADRAGALQAATFELNGLRVAVVGIDEVVDPADEVAGPHRPGTAAGYDFGLALRAVRRAAATSDIVVVAIHWGIELDRRPSPYQIAQAHRLIDAGADVIFGAHPHTLQPMETYRGRPIFYSLGNLVWPRLTPALRTTAVAEVIVRPDGSIGGRLLPAQIAADGHPVLTRGAKT